jgi:hypothetical protein
MGDGYDELPLSEPPGHRGEEGDEAPLEEHFGVALETPDDDPFDDATSELIAVLPRATLDGEKPAAHDDDGTDADPSETFTLIGDATSAGASMRDEDALEGERGDFGVAGWIGEGGALAEADDHDGPLDSALDLPDDTGAIEHEARAGEELHEETPLEAPLRGGASLPRWADRAWDVRELASRAPLSGVSSSRAGALAWGPRGTLLLGPEDESEPAPAGVPLGAVAWGGGRCVAARDGTYLRGPDGLWSRIGEASVLAVDEAGGLLRADASGELWSGVEPARAWASVGRIVAVGSADGVGCVVCAVEAGSGAVRLWRVQGVEARAAVAALVPSRIRVAAVAASGQRVALLGANGEVHVAPQGGDRRCAKGRRAVRRDGALPAGRLWGLRCRRPLR